MRLEENIIINYPGLFAQFIGVEQFKPTDFVNVLINLTQAI